MSETPDASTFGIPRTMALVVAAFVLGGVAVGVIFFPGEWSLLRRVVGGVLLGSGAAICLTLNKLIG